MDQIVREIVFTGGPCAGKTTGMTVVADELRAGGWRVLTVPEAATMFIEGGIPDIAEIAADAGRYAHFQHALIGTQAALRDRYRSMAEALGDERTVILYDRAECDVAAYVGVDLFAQLLEAEGRSLLRVRDSYDAVIHMVSAAIGAEDAYTLENNVARHETVEQAAELDRATLGAWLGHPRLHVIDNSTGFDAKIERTLVAVRGALGEPAPLEIERKYLLAGSPPAEVLAAAHRVELTQTYLPGENGIERRVRKYSERGAQRYEMTTKERVSATTRIEREHEIDVFAYTARVCESVGTVAKTRWHFVDGNQVFSVDQLHRPDAGWFLEIELTSDDVEVTLPDWAATAVEVTGDSAYSMAALATVE